MAEYANIIVDISHEKLDKTFQYRIPERLKPSLEVGMQVFVPFGARKIQGYVVELTDHPEYEVDKIKDVTGIVKKGVAIESQMIALAAWMRKNYGGTMNQALKTVLPVREKKKKLEQKTVRLALHPVEAKNQLAEYERKHSVARARLLDALLSEGELDWNVITRKLNVTGSVITAMEEAGVVKVLSRQKYRNPVEHLKQTGYDKILNEEQRNAVSEITGDYDAGIRKTYLIKGVTGSGKTEVYMELISHVQKQGRQAIVLIPEIALTYQTVMRFYNRFGDRVSIMNSRLSAGERYDQCLRAQNGEIDIVIGPRSALFTPFPDLGLIIIDEEHETSYKSETVPKYHARETAIKRAEMTGASVVLGSATPSVDSYYKAKCGEYRLLELKNRVMEKPLPVCEIVDLREELKKGNRSILSERLTEQLEDRLRRHQQTILFINRRGIAGFVSCRACGHVIKCPHCDVSLSQHNNGRMVCHYCGYEEPVPKVCPACGSKYISGFKAGTQKIEQVVKERFPQAKVLRMDMDTTRGKEGHEQILSAFANQEADILIGTQMIVKGHDFPNVTLVGVLAADMSLHIGDFHAPERTFELLTQAAGRAGRGEVPGNVVIQTYTPEHYSITTASVQDYEAFYEQEIEYRKMMYYPPVWNLLVILCASKEEQRAHDAAALLVAQIDETKELRRDRVFPIGPADAAIAKVSDVYKKVVYIKAEKYQALVGLKDMLEEYMRDNRSFSDVIVQFDFNPAGSF
ncbi:MAG: primosomal protein N' [Clostridiales bacterium]|nr:primosomal protein N' [Clostridiales bacterium]